ncbi:MAG: hypothetical protein WA231_20585 [Methylocella sp.]
MRDLSHADVGIGEHRLGGLDVLLSDAAIIATPANITPYNSTIESTGALFDDRRSREDWGGYLRGGFWRRFAVRE